VRMLEGFRVVERREVILVLGRWASWLPSYVYPIRISLWYLMLYMSAHTIVYLCDDDVSGVVRFKFGMARLERNTPFYGPFYNDI